MSDVSTLKIRNAYYTFLTTFEEDSQSSLYTGKGHAYDQEIIFNRISGSVVSTNGLILRAGGGIRTTPLLEVCPAGDRVFGINKDANLQFEEQDNLPSAPSNTSSSYCFVSNSLFFYGEL